MKKSVVSASVALTLCLVGCSSAEQPENTTASEQSSTTSSQSSSTTPSNANSSSPEELLAALDQVDMLKSVPGYLMQTSQDAGSAPSITTLGQLQDTFADIQLPLGYLFSEDASAKASRLTYVGTDTVFSGALPFSANISIAGIEFDQSFTLDDLIDGAEVEAEQPMYTSSTYEPIPGVTGIIFDTTLRTEAFGEIATSAVYWLENDGTQLYSLVASNPKGLNNGERQWAIDLVQQRNVTANTTHPRSA